MTTCGSVVPLLGKVRKPLTVLYILLVYLASSSLFACYHTYDVVPCDQTDKDNVTS